MLHLNHKIDACVVCFRYDGALILLRNVIAVEGAGIDIGFEIRSVGGVWRQHPDIGVRPALRPGQRRQRLGAGTAPLHNQPGDAKAAVALGRGIHLQGNLHFLVEVAHKIVGVEHRGTKFGFRGHCTDGIAVQILHCDLYAANIPVVHTLQDDDKVVFSDYLYRHVLRAGIGQYSFPRRHAGHAGAVARAYDGVSGHGDLLWSVLGNQHLLQPLGKAEFDIAVDHLLRRHNHKDLEGGEHQHFLAQRFKLIRGLPDLLGEARRFEVKQLALRLGKGLGVLFDNHHILLNAPAEIPRLLLHSLRVQHHAVAFSLECGVICCAVGEMCVGRRIFVLHLLENRLGAGEYVGDVVDVPEQLVVQPVHQHLGIPGLVRRHARMIAALLHFKSKGGGAV